MKVIREVGNRAVAEDRIVGLSIAVARDGRVVFAEGFGYADLERRRPVTVSTAFDVASVGKQFTAAAIMRLVEDGELSLDDHIKSIVPEVPSHFPNATVYELLHHTSGFVAGRVDYVANPPRNADRPRKGIEVLDDAELLTGEIRFAPSETHAYCNPGFLILGVAVEAASGQSYATFVRDKLLRPAGLSDMTVCERADASRMADSLHRDDDRVVAMPLIDMTVYSGQGSICSSAIDLLRWQRALTHGEIVSLDSFEQMSAPARVRGSVAEVPLPYGMGLRLGRFRGNRKIGHTGTFEGGTAILAHYPDTGLTVAVLSNTGGDVPHARLIEAEIAEKLLPDRRGPRHAVPVASRDAARIEGVYCGRKCYEARVDGADLRVLHEGREVARLTHVGDLIFESKRDPDVREWFLLDGDRAGWWLIESHGYISGNYALRRADPIAGLSSEGG